ncbi:hypothetical protein BGZ46_010551 [Entomortierella lignicola]|nr:hypothetical protein BGZ46_010551 [Entomortierella lignicola]
MVIGNPLYVPEIVILISEYLKKDNIVECLRVCKHWYKFLLPDIWRSFSPAYNFPIPTTTPFRKNHELICHFSLHFDATELEVFKLTFPNLRTLQLSGGQPNNHIAVEFINLNPTVVNLELDFSEEEVVVGLWKSVSGLSHLKVLRTQNTMPLCENERTAFWKACKNVQEVRFHNTLYFPSELAQYIDV